MSIHGHVQNSLLGGRTFFITLGGVIKLGTWHCAVECSVSVSNRVIYIHPSQLSYNYDDIVVSCCNMQHFLHVIFFLSANWEPPINTIQIRTTNHAALFAPRLMI